VTSGLTSNLDDVTGALQAAGISGAVFSGVNGYQPVTTDPNYVAAGEHMAALPQTS